MIPEYFVLVASWSAVSLASTSLWVAAAVSASLVFCFNFRLAISHRTRKIGASANQTKVTITTGFIVPPENAISPQNAWASLSPQD
jgi:hypothetical protein